MQVKEEDLLDAVVRLFNEIIYLHDVEKAVFCDGEVRAEPTTGGGVVLEAELRGEVFDPSRHCLRSHLKAATYHLLKVTPLEIQLIFDV